MLSNFVHNELGHNVEGTKLKIFVQILANPHLVAFHSIDLNIVDIYEFGTK
jgi:hypothetical protein